MTMSWIWTGILGLSVFCAFLTGQGSALAASVAQGAQSGVTLAVSIGGSVCLWTGVGKLMERSGVTAFLSKLLSPLLHRLFPTSKQDALTMHYLCANVCANILGVGNAATPMGIQAAKRLAPSDGSGIASDELCRLIVLNTASIQLIPANVAAIRGSLGAVAPFDVLPAVWITSLASTFMGLCAAGMFGRLLRHD